MGSFHSARSPLAFALIAFIAQAAACTEGQIGDSPPGAAAAGVGGSGGSGGLADLPQESDSPPEGQGGAAGAGGAGGSAGQGGSDATAEEGPCPPDMAFITTFCMDRYEAPNIKGAKPLVMESALSGTAWCEQHGKRLCTEAEWVVACRGPDDTKYPYGDTHEAGRCNDDKKWIWVDEQALATWPSGEALAEVEKLWQGAPSGDYDGCTNGYGVYDLTGNVEEWVVRTEPHANNYPHVMKGCYWAGCYGGNKPTCASTNPNHGESFRFYETGFRCCMDPKKSG